MISEELQKKMPEIIRLLKEHKVKSAYLFGSATKGTISGNSDIDLLVSLKYGLEPAEAGEYLWELQEKLQELLNREVDLLTEHSLKNPWFIKEINTTKVQIYG